MIHRIACTDKKHNIDGHDPVVKTGFTVGCGVACTLRVLASPMILPRLYEYLWDMDDIVAKCMVRSIS